MVYVHSQHTVELATVQHTLLQIPPVTFVLYLQCFQGGYMLHLLSHTEKL